MLLCMSLSKKNDDVGVFIADHSNICPVCNFFEKLNLCKERKQ